MEHIISSQIPYTRTGLHGPTCPHEGVHAHTHACVCMCTQVGECGNMVWLNAQEEKRTGPQTQSLMLVESMVKRTITEWFFLPSSLRSCNRNNTQSGSFIIRSGWSMDKDQKKSCRQNWWCSGAHSSKISGTVCTVICFTLEMPASARTMGFLCICLMRVSLVLRRWRDSIHRLEVAPAGLLPLSLGGTPCPRKLCPWFLLCLGFYFPSCLSSSLAS